MPRANLSALLLPPGVRPDAKLLLAARALRAFGDGFVSLLLPFYLTLLGHNAFEVGVIVTATLLGSGAMTLAAGFVAHRYRQRSLLLAASVLAAATGTALSVAADFWPLLLIAAMGTLNPSIGDVTIFAPLEHALLARTVEPEHRTALFARYTVVGALVGALGAQAAAMPALLQHALALEARHAVQTMFALYGALGIVALLLYRRLPAAPEPGGGEAPPAPLGKSKRMVYTLAALFSLDSFAGGFAVQSLIALWLFERFDLSIAAAGAIFFWAGMLSAFSQLVSARIARRIGLVNTMVFTHLPSNVFLILVALMPTLPLAVLFLLARSALSQMDVPARSSYVMAVVSPEERPAAASVTAVPRSLAAAVSPTLTGHLLAASSFGWPLVIAGALKIAYDLLLLKMFRRIWPPEETATGKPR